MLEIASRKEITAVGRRTKMGCYSRSPWYYKFDWKKVDMPRHPTQSTTIPSCHVGVAAEAFAACQLLPWGFDVSVQYGANQPEYDLMVASGSNLLKVSVKVSQDWRRALTQSQLEQATKKSSWKGDYHGAIDIWLEREAWCTLGGVITRPFCSLLRAKDHEQGKMQAVPR